MKIITKKIITNGNGNNRFLYCHKLGRAMIHPSVVTRSPVNFYKDASANLVDMLGKVGLCCVG
ncbi:MAG: hypothetical protein EOP06_06820 [Proteobacteria bacterium]|nr:MAG: hypothetical protein EOP06_06820 [Pseudomonadota bacterium]